MDELSINMSGDKHFNHILNELIRQKKIATPMYPIRIGYFRRPYYGFFISEFYMISHTKDRWWIRNLYIIKFEHDYFTIYRNDNTEDSIIVKNEVHTRNDIQKFLIDFKDWIAILLNRSKCVPIYFNMITVACKHLKEINKQMDKNNESEKYRPHYQKGFIKPPLKFFSN